MAPIRVYADTSVFGGVFDPQFAAASTRFFDLVRRGTFELVVSPAIQAEIVAAPPPVTALFDEVVAGNAVLVTVSTDAIALQAAYLRHRILGRRWEDDALHVALATVCSARVLVSWNFKHIVNFRRIPLFNAVNQSMGYPSIAIHSPPQSSHMT